MGSAVAPTNVAADSGQSHRHNVQPSRPALPNMQKQTQHAIAHAAPHSLVGPGQAGSKSRDPIDLKVLVISADGNETDYPAIKAFLSQIGVPFGTLIATQTPLTSSMLWDGGLHGYYEGIILATGNLTYYNATDAKWESAFNDAEWAALWQYESLFRIRQATSYTFPYGYPDNYGLNLVTYQDTTTAPLQARLTSAGANVYSYLNAANPVTFKNAWVYLATPIDTTTTPLLQTADGYTIASIHTYADGRQNLTITAENNPYLIHSMLLSYGTINWVTKGLFLGQRHVQLDTTVDDLFIDDNLWDPVALNDLNDSYNYRITGSDIQALLNWQSSVDANRVTSGVKVEWAFNGQGTVAGEYVPDTLTPAVQARQGQFNFVNHTYSHINLDNPVLTAAQYTSELQQNNKVAKALGFENYWRDTFVQPDISGLSNQVFQQAANAWGINYMISDTSRAGWNNPTPNAGFYAQYAPILIIPRHPSNLFYNLTTPAEWVSEYNCYYGPVGGPNGSGSCLGGQWSYWSQPLTYPQILDVESNFMLSYLLKWDIDPLMFHQPNIKAYDGVHSLYGDLIGTVLAKYTAVYNLPIVDDSEHNIGIDMAQRMGYDASGVKASLVPCQSITVTTVAAAVIPVTGVRSGGNAEDYGGQSISHLKLDAGQSVTIPTTVGC
jgi:hypothetical protein